MQNSALKEVQSLLGGATFPNCESPSLRLEKFVRVGKDHGKDTKSGEIDAVVRLSSCHVPAPVLPKNGCWNARSARMDAKLAGRLIVNQAGGILENAGLCLHPHFGYPYIPGSAVKGVARHAAWCEWNGEKDETKKVELAKKIARIFGYPTNDKSEDGLDAFLRKHEPNLEACGGCVSFLAAIPKGNAPLVKDIVNCHHSEYYRGKTDSATDGEAPIPVFFPAVEKGVLFEFTIVRMRGATEDDLEQARKWLAVAMTKSGIGAKTSAGYGWFDWNEEEYVKKHDRERKERERDRRRKDLHDRIDRLANLNEAEPAFAEEVNAIQKTIVEFEEWAKRNGFSCGLDQEYHEKFKQYLKKVALPPDPPCKLMLREWEGLDAKACLLSHGAYVRKFAMLQDSEKANIVKALRTHDVWNKFLRDDGTIDRSLSGGEKKKHAKDLKALSLAIRKFAKDVLKEKMP